MILSGKEIIKEVENGRIHIEPFDISNINPKSTPSNNPINAIMNLPPLLNWFYIFIS